MSSNDVAKTICEQIGNRAFFMLGAKDLVSIENGLRFRIRGSSDVSHVEVILDPSDTYTMKFQKVRGIKVKDVAEKSFIYADQLHAMIECHTGLATSL